MTNTVWTPMFK